MVSMLGHLKEMSPRFIPVYAFVLALSCLFVAIHAKGLIPFVACPPSSFPHSEKRGLYVATCDSRDGWKEFMALKTWNVTGYNLRNGNSGVITSSSSSSSSSTPPLSMENVCKGHPWGGFLTKPLLYLAWLKTLPLKTDKGGDNHVILMDSDTFWSVPETENGSDSGITSIWNKYDCARQGRDVLLSTEMSCWIGRYCTQEDMYRYYNHTSSTPSVSPFLNSGVVMGKIQPVVRMLEYVIANNQSYYITYFKSKFDDQYAYTDYALKVVGLGPQGVMVDYYQQLLASFSIHAPGDPHEDGWPFSCRTLDEDTRWPNSICPSCPNWTQLLTKHGYFTVDTQTCAVQRRSWDKMPLEKQLATLAPSPIIWHGNGVGKKAYYHFAHQAFLCNLNKRGLNETYYTENFCCD